MWFVRRDDEEFAYCHYHSRARRAARRRPLPEHAGSCSFAVTSGIRGLVRSMDYYQERTETPFDPGALRTLPSAGVSVNICDIVYRAITV
jgi:hypothetical protein